MAFVIAEGRAFFFEQVEPSLERFVSRVAFAQCFEGLFQADVGIPRRCILRVRNSVNVVFRQNACVIGRA